MKNEDEYDWKIYSEEYSNQLDEISVNDNIEFFLERENGIDKNADKLHANWRELYDTVEELKPNSAFECGFGAGYHLVNIRTVSPSTIVHGCDLLESQFRKAEKFSSLTNDILCNLRVMDFTKHLDVQRQYDFVYSMAVVMHLSTQNAIAFLKNMGLIAKKHIFMVEGIANHENWFDLVRETLPEFEFEMRTKYVDNGILLTRK